MYNLIWYVNGKPKETILQNKPRTICQWKRNELECTTHTVGKLILQRA